MTKAELEAKCRENEVEIIRRVCGKKKMRITKEYLMTLLEKSGFVDDDEVHLDVKAVPEELEVSFDECYHNFRLPFCRVYGNIQGLTIKNKHILLLDTNHKFFTLLDLIVALSRSSRRMYMHIPTNFQELEFMTRCAI